MNALNGPELVTQRERRSAIGAHLRTSARRLLVGWRSSLFRRVWGMDIGEGCIVSLKARLDKTNPRGVHVGRYTAIGLDVIVLSHDFVRNRWSDTWIGERCHIGAGAIICPGVRIGDGCVVAPGSVVLTDVPDGCLIVGNPARIVERGITVGKWGVRLNDIPSEGVDQKSHRILTLF